jgi:hypothetical protein
MMKLEPRRAAPTVLAGALALAYVLVSPPSYDLAAHLLRAKLFSQVGFGLWNNWWFGGHDTLGYSVVFPPLAAATSPQVVAGAAAPITAALFEALTRYRYGDRALLGATWFAAATAVNLLSGRLTFAFGLMFCVATALALQRGRPSAAAGAALLSALASPVAALFTALIAVTYGVPGVGGERDRKRALVGGAIAATALLPVAALAVLFPEGGTEPFAFSALWPIPVIAIGFVVLLGPEEREIKLGAALYAAATLAAYAVDSPVGSNAARLGPLVAGPLAALVWWRRRTAWLVLAAAPLVYLQWQAPINDVATSAGNPALKASYWRPLLSFLRSEGGGPFRIEIPFTRLHWESYRVAPSFPLARGWERQLDIKDNRVFYSGTLTASRYERWLHRLAVRYVAVASGPVDYSATAEVRLIDRGLPYLREIWHSRHFRVYAVADPTPIATGPVTLTALGPNSVTLRANRAGRFLLRIRYTPYWKLGTGAGCVSRAGDFTALEVRRSGPVKLVVAFALDRIGASSPRCT